MQFSIVTSFNARLYRHSAQVIYNSVHTTYPTIDFYVYHENSFDQEKFGDEIVPEYTWPQCNWVDLFEAQPWLSKFLDESDFKRCITSKYYWNKNSIFWFRKVVSINDCVKKCKTPLLIWADCDVYFKKPFDQKLLDYAKTYDICYIKRPLMATDSGFIIFNLERRGAKFAEEWLKIYTNSNAFKEKRWDDGYILDVVAGQHKFDTGTLTRKFLGPINIYDYIHHLKEPLKDVRAKF